jgi:DNA-binding NarL/FixJ family response regulator
LRLVLDGGVYVPASAVGLTPDSSGKESDPQEFVLSERQRRKVKALGLSNREIEVLERLVAGHSNKAIGSALDIQECTVKAHVSTILRTVHAGSRTQVIYLVTHGHLA